MRRLFLLFFHVLSIVRCRLAATEHSQGAGGGIAFVVNSG